MKAPTFISILFILLTISCKSTKDVNKNNEDRQLTENIKTTTTRVGDTVHYEVPNIILKDTTVTIKNYKTGTTQILKYNNEGKLTSADCISGIIQIIEENNRILVENINNMNKAKTSEISPSIILYAFIGFALFIVIILTVAFFLFKKYLKTLIPLIPD